MGKVDTRDARRAWLEAQPAEDQATIAALRREPSEARATFAELRATVAQPGVDPLIRLALSLVILAAPLALAQAVAPLPEPVAEPAPSFSTPGATPAGAGASHGGLATPEQELAPQSPNKRVLPPSSEPGVWAADQPRGAARAPPPTIAGVEILVPETDSGEFEARVCADEMDRRIKSEGQMSALMDLRPDDRQCVVARLEAYCWQFDFNRTQSPERLERLRIAIKQTRQFELYACRNTRDPKPVVDKVVAAVKRGWDITAMQRERAPVRRRRR